MAVLQRQEAEIPLNGGMDTSAGAEYQSVSTLRAVTDLRWNDDGELEKRPATASTQAIVNPGDVGVYEGLGGAGVVESRGEVYVVTDNYGAMNSGGRYVGAGGGAVGTAVPFSYDLTPKLCSVARRQIDRCSGNDAEQGFAAYATCLYSSTTLVTAAVVYVASGSGCVLRLRAVSLETGAVLAQLQYDTDAALASQWSVDACENTDATTPGAVITFGSGSGAPFTIKKYRYRAATQDFVSDGAIASDAQTSKHRIKTSPSAAGRFLFAYETTGAILYAVDATCTAFTPITTHTGTHSAAGGVDIVISGTKVCLASGSGGTGGQAYAERFGLPAAAITVESFDATRSIASVTAARQTGSGNDDQCMLVVSVVVNAAGSIPDYGEMYAFPVNFTASPCVSLAGAPAPPTLNVMALGTAVTFDDRAYVLALPILSVDEAPTPAWVRCDNIFTANYAVARAPVARVCHDVFAYPVNAPGLFSNLYSAHSDSTRLHVALPTDLSVDKMPGPISRVGQSVAICSVDMQSRPVTYAHKNDVATVASGVAFDIDGDMPSLSQAWCRPVVTIDVSSAGAESAATGLGVIAIYRWVDASGRLHRSAPSAAVNSGVFAAKRMDVYVSALPFEPFAEDVYRLYSVELYVTSDGGSTYYLANDASGYQATTYTVAGGSWKFTRVFEGSAGSAGSVNAQVYSTGDGNEALTSDPPPAFHAICTVGDRMWAIDAEDRTRIWPSKPFEAGYAVEWNIANTLFLGDEGVGISDVGGVPTVFCERGVWQIYGEGPNANGSGSFAPARRLPHEVACLDALSVCKTPMGVAFRARQGVMLLDNGLGLQPIGRALASTFISGTPTGYCKIAYDELSDELHVLDFDTKHFVMNMGEGKWSQWTQDSAFQDWGDCVCVAGRMWFLQRGSSVTDSLCRAKAIDESDHNTHVYGWTIQTPWIRFDGVTGDMRIWETLPQIRLGAAVANTPAVTCTYETRDNVDEVFTFSSADIIALGSAGQTKNLRCRIGQAQRTRQFRMTITESAPAVATAGHVPVGMRVLYGITQGGSRKTSTTQNKGGT